MKKFENLGVSLSKEDQKNINGGVLEDGCASPTVKYCCDIEYTDDTLSQQNFCAESLIAAKAAALSSANNVFSATCELAG